MNDGWVKADVLSFLKTCATIKRKTNEGHLVCPHYNDEIVSTATDNTHVSRTTSEVVNDKILDDSVVASLLRPQSKAHLKAMLVLPSYQR